MNLSGILATSTVQSWQRAAYDGANCGAYTNVIAPAITVQSATSIIGNNVTSAVCYRAAVINGTCTTPAFSTAAIITLHPGSVGGDVTPEAQTICTGSQPNQTLTLAGNTGTIEGWQRVTSANCATANWATAIVVPGSAGQQTLPPALIGALTTAPASNTTYCFRAQVQSASCGVVFSDHASITVNPQTVAGSIAPPAPLCHNTSTDLTVTGIVGAITGWDRQEGCAGAFTPIAGATSATLNTGALTNPTAANRTICYRVRVKSGECPEQSTGVTVTVFPQAVAGTLNGAQTVCTGANNGALTLSGHVGTVVEWARSTTGPAGPWTAIANTTTTQTYTNLTQTTWYAARVRSGASCPIVETPAAQIFVTLPTVALTSATNVQCFGFANGTINVTPAGGGVQGLGAGGYTYNWTRNGAPYATTEDLANLPAGQYCVTVTDVLGCTATLCRTITEPTELVATLDGSTNITCNGYDNGTITTTVAGGTLPYNYAWTGPTAIATNVGDPTGLAPGTYAVTITDGAGCVRTLGPVTLTQPDGVTVVVSYFAQPKCNGESNGEIGIDTYGGAPPYTWAWSNGVTNEDIKNIPGGLTYIVTITDSRGCVFVEDFFMPQPTKVVINLNSQQNVLCKGETTGMLDVDVTGGTTPYTYNWSTGSTVEDIDDLGAGAYTLIATDANGCTAERTFTIAEPAVTLQAFVQIETPVSCTGGANGALRALVTGGTAPYAYAWTGGQTTAVATGLAAGVYTVIITDAAGCKAGATFTLAGGAALSVVTHQAKAPTCSDKSDGKIDIEIANAQAPVQYVWTRNGQPLPQNTEDLTGLTGGVYALTATDARGCAVTQSWTLTAPAPLAVTTPAVVKPLCANTPTGTIDVLVTGGTAPYAYAWNDAFTGEDRVNVVGAIYTVTVSDANGCTKTQTIDLRAPNPIKLTVESLQTVACNGGSDGAIGINTTGGVQPYTYKWSNNAVTEDLQNLKAGLYTITATDGNGCKAVRTIAISQPAALTVTVVSTTAPSCAGRSDGAATLAVTGGTAPYRYVWPAGEKAAQATGLAGGPHVVTIVDAKNCEKTTTVTLPTGPTITVTATITRAAVCSADGHAVTAAAAGGAAPYTIRWYTVPGGLLAGTGASTTLSGESGAVRVEATDANGCTGEFTLNTPVVTPLTATATAQNAPCTANGAGSALAAASGGVAPYTYKWSNNWLQAALPNAQPGTYRVTITDANGCAATAEAVITRPPLMTATVGAVTNVKCRGEATGKITLNVTGGTTPYNYVWSNATTTADLTNVAAGLYRVTVSDAAGCVAELGPIEVKQPATGITSTLLVSRAPRCGQPNGRLSIAVTGGVPPYAAQWSNAGVGFDLTGLTAGRYTVTIADANGCTLAQSYTLDGAAPIAIDLSYVKDESCAGRQDGEIGVSISGGVEPYRYFWNNGATTEDLFGLTAGTYTLVVSDAANCSATATFEVGGAPAMTVTVTTTAAGCTPTGGALVAVTGGRAPYTFAWSDGGSGAARSDLAAGNYLVTVTDTKGCAKTANVTIENASSLTIEEQFVEPISCANASDGSIGVNVFGGVQPYTYAWTDNVTVEDRFDLAPGFYTLIVTDAAGCTATRSWTLTAPPSLEIATAFTRAARCGRADGGGGVTVTGGQTPYTYMWSNAQQTATLLNVEGGAYTVTVTDAAGCTGVHTVTVPASSGLTATVGQVLDELCAGTGGGAAQIIAQGGAAPYQYLWSDIGPGPAARGELSAGVYIVTVADAANCRVTLTVTVGAPAPLTMTVESVVAGACTGAATGAATVRASGGVGPYFYQWSNNQDGQSLTGVNPGTYTVTITDGNGCLLIEDVTVPAEDGATATISGLNASYCASAPSVTLGGLPLGGTFTGAGMTGAQFDPAQAGAGVHEITYAGTFNSCPFEVKQTVTVLAGPGAVTTNLTGNFCESDGAARDLLYTPVTPGVTAAWNGPGVFQVAGLWRWQPSSAGAGVHALKLTLTDTQTGCTREQTVTVTVNAVPTLDVAADKMTICGAGPATLIAAGAESFSWAPSTGLDKTTGSEVKASPTRTTTYTVTGSNGACSVSRTITIRVTTAPAIVVVPSAPTICPGSAATLTAISNGAYTYTWAPATGLSATTGATVAASPAATTTYTVTGESANGCSATTTVTVTVAPSLVQVSATTTNICGNQSALLTATSTEPGVFSYVWAPATGLLSTTGPVVTAKPTVTTTYTVTRSGTGGCRSAVITITVGSGLPATITGLPAALCPDASGETLQLTGEPAGGTFTGGPGVQITSDGAFTKPSAPGTYTVTYTVGGGDCPTVATATVVVEGAPDAMFINLKPQYCLNALPSQIMATPAGGAYGGPGVTPTGLFDPSKAGAGVHEIEYAGFTPGGCAYRIVKTVEVVAPDVAIQGLRTRYCATGEPATLTGSPAGGTFSGPGVIGGAFFPNIAGTGVHNITYSGVSGPCNYSITVQVTVTTPPVVTGVATATTCGACADGTITAVATGGAGGYQYSLNNGPLSSAPIFDGLTAGVYTLTVIDAGGCTATTTVVVPAGGGAGCGQPQFVTANPQSTTAIIQWGAVTGATSYEVSWRIVGSPTFTTTTVAAPTTLAIATGLTAGRQYEVRVRARCANGQFGAFTSATFTTFAGRAGEELGAETTVTAYPNPARDAATLRWATGGVDAVSLATYDAKGALVWRATLTGADGEVELPTADWAAGVYLCRLALADGREFTLKLVRE